MRPSVLKLLPSAPFELGYRTRARSEAELIRYAKESSEGFALLYRQNYAAIRRYIHHRVGDEHVVNDLVAETFMTALENLHRFRERGLPLRAWLYRLATSRISRWLRRLPAKPTQSLELTETTAVVGVPEQDPRLELVRQALRDLPLVYQEALSLHHLEELSVRQVALTLGINENTIKARLVRGREHLRRRLAVHGELRWD